MGIKIFLESNGSLPKHLAEIISLIDIVSMDIKLPSASGGGFNIKENTEFLEIAFNKEVFVKVITVPETTIKEIDDAAKIVAGVHEDIPFIIQPATMPHSIKHKPSMELLFAWHNVAKKRLKNVRVIPQVHKVLGAL